MPSDRSRARPVWLPFLLIILAVLVVAGVLWTVIQWVIT